MFSRRSQKSWRLAVFILTLPIFLILLYPSLSYISSFTHQAVVFKSTANKITSNLVPIKLALEKVNLKAQITPTGEIEVLSSAPGKEAPLAYLVFFKKEDEEGLIQYRKDKLMDIKKYSPNTQIEETILTREDWNIYAYTIISPRDTTKQEAIIVHSNLKRMKINLDKRKWYPFNEIQILCLLNRIYYGYRLSSSDFPSPNFWRPFLIPGKLFCNILIPILGFTPYHLLFIWPLVFIIGAAIYIKHRLEQRQSASC